jgi:hypothetical protein
MGQQLKKFFFDKKLTDSGTGNIIATWRANPWKICSVFIGIALLCTMVYGYFFSGDPPNFFGNLLFYVIIIAIAIAILYILASTISKFRKLIVGFLIALILLFVAYWAMGFAFTYTGLLKNWHIGGWSLPIVLVFLAFLGSKRLDNNLDRADVFFSIMCGLVFIGINIPFANNVGLLANIDNLISKIIGLSPWKL